MNAVTKHEAVQDVATTTHKPEPTNMLAVLSQAAQNPAVDVTKLQALLDMQERIENKQARQEFASALVRLQRVMPRVKKNGTVELGSGKGSYKFATWEDMDKLIRPLMLEQGFTFQFDTERREGGGAKVIGTLIHEAGHEKTASVDLALDAGPGRNNLQAMGSTISYGKRYCAELLLNIVREGADDDGTAGGQHFIPNEAANAIAAALHKRNIPLPEFLDFLGVTSLGEIETKDLPKAKNAIASYKPRPPVETGE